MTPPPPRQSPTPPAAIQQLRRALDLHRAGQTDQAITQLRALLQRHPAVAAAHDTLAKLLILSGRAEEALYAAKRCEALAPEMAESHLVVAHAHAAALRHAEALASFERAAALATGKAPLAAEAAAGAGRALAYLHRPEAALAALRRAVELDPRRIDARVNLGLALLDSGRPREAVDALRAAAAARPGDAYILDTLAFASTYDDRATPEQVFQDHRAFGRALEARVTARPAEPSNPDPDRPLRVAFLSRDLHQHSISAFLLPLLESLERSRVVPCCVALGRRSDSVTESLRRASDEWHDAAGLSDPALDALLRERDFDAVVELSGHTTGHRLAVLARRPAPLLVSWLGYANTTGLSCLNARFVDGMSDPDPAADAHATEPLVRLDPCFLCYRPPEHAPEPSAPPEGAFTFCSFNDFKKLTPSTIDAYAIILSRAPGSRLLLKSIGLGAAESRERVRTEFAQRGIPADRVELLGRIDDPAEHLGLYRRAHLALDTFPYAGTTTTCEALWMGVPVLTMAGDRHASRVGASLLTAIALPELIASSQEDFVARAEALVADRTRLASLRAGLRQRVALSPLRDEPGFARRFEEAFRRLWHAAVERRA